MFCYSSLSVGCSSFVLLLRLFVFVLFVVFVVVLSLLYFVVVAFVGCFCIEFMFV